MKKGILLFIAAFLLLGIVGYVVWTINRRHELSNNSKDSFIPYNSALVVSLNKAPVVSEKFRKSFGKDIDQLQHQLLWRMADTLGRKGFTSPDSRVWALRIEGKDKPVALCVMDNKDVLSRNEVIAFLKNVLGNPTERIRKYDNYKIFHLKSAKESLYCAAEEGMILLSDSELYLEDALKRFERTGEKETTDDGYRNIDKYFSASAGMNIFLNTACFTDVLPMVVQPDRIFKNLDLRSCFKWGALDGDFTEEGLTLNGFMHYTDMDASYMKTLEGQHPKETVLGNIIPETATSVLLLNLSDLKTYLAELDNYRYNAGLIERIRRRKQEYSRLMGKDAEMGIKELLQGEMASVNMSFQPATGECEGVIVANLKSGGLCKAWIEKVVENYARVKNVHPDSYKRSYSPDGDKKFAYYKFPVEDLAPVLWGYVFEGIKSRYALVVDNYLVLASSEKVVGNFLKAYIHRNFIRDAEWLKNVKDKLSAKYNLAYFANTRNNWAYYRFLATAGLQSYLKQREDELSVFSALALQWANEGDMLYSTLFLSTQDVQSYVKPHVLWQTKLDAKVSIKPVPVLNHVNGEKELLVQDDGNTLYLLNDAGGILWKLPLEEKINSEIYQVDAFKNNKLQYLFSTPSRIYLVDRNGNFVNGYPLRLKSPTMPGITVFDYDKNRNYRIFVPCSDGLVYLYDIKGKRVEGWKPAKTDKEIMSRVMHFRVKDKDYIVYADCFRLYILDRKGKERVRVSTLFDIAPGTPLYLTRKGEMACVAFLNKKGPVSLVDFTGNVQTVKCGVLSDLAQMNVADIDNNGTDDFIFTDGSQLSVYNIVGQTIYSVDLEAKSLDFPYVYRFSSDDQRIGLLDSGQNRMLMVSLKTGLSKGFPIEGESPFSIVFAGKGDFYLFAGTDQGSIIKYRVQH